ncbi:MAG TPA: CoA pyrophosphatase, partial [Thermoanaerobaculia bacterium]|nr:CoA pyrophosphatase [Thermoanaerobaculia bacterium]
MSWVVDLRERLATPPPRRLPPPETRRAAVLVPLYVDAGELWVLLTTRADGLPHHRSQIAFPGGSIELGEDAWQAAARETEEELGIAPPLLLELGRLDEVDTPTGFHVLPFVAAVPHPVPTRPNPAEIAEVFPLPLTALANPQLIEEREVLIDGRSHAIVVFHVGGR